MPTVLALGVPCVAIASNDEFEAVRPSGFKGRLLRIRGATASGSGRGAPPRRGRVARQPRLQYDRTIDSRTENLYRQFQADTFKDKVIRHDGRGQADRDGRGSQAAGRRPDQGQAVGGSRGKSNDDSTGDKSGAPDDATIDERVRSTPLLSAITGDEGSGGRYSKSRFL